VLKDLIVHLDGTSEDELRLGHAETIMAGRGGRITGLFTNPLPEYVMASGFDPAFSSIAGVAQLQERLHDEGLAVAARLKQRMTRLEAPGELRKIEAGGGELPGLCASEARCADLFVASGGRPDDARLDWSDLVETILFEAGRAVYLAPRGGKPPPAIRKVLVAWRDTREAARAVAEALPFLRAAEATRVVTIGLGRDGDASAAAAADIAAHLDRHGVRVEVSAIEGGDRAIAEVLREEARRMKADLVVMGAYGHSRFREWVLGGATRDMIGGSETPLLLAH
jgi:nucleotide-binding universal stress UspA family protein